MSQILLHETTIQAPQMMSSQSPTGQDSNSFAGNHQSSTQVTNTSVSTQEQLPQPELVITQQPKREYRFRYPAERSARWWMQGRERNTFPSVQLRYYPTDQSAYVRVCLYTRDGHEKHYHKLVGDQKEYYSEKEDCVMDVDENNQCIFKNLLILRRKKQEVFEMLARNEADELGEDTPVIREHVRRKVDSIQLKYARLGFQAYQKGTNHPIGNPVLSEEICDTRT